MQNGNFKTTLLTVSAIFIFFSVTFAQVIPRRIEINAEHSLRADQAIDMKAYETICIKEGFKMTPGSSLRLMVIPQKKKSIDNNPDLVRTTVYPNPCVNQVNVKGSFINASVIIFDGSGNPAMISSLTGTDPAIDVSTLKEGTYVLKTSEFTTRFSKK